MCAIVGAVLSPEAQQHHSVYQDVLNHIWKASHARGRDGAGWVRPIDAYRADHMLSVVRNDDTMSPPRLPDAFDSPVVLLGNLRAEPTTEFVEEKSWTDQQPYYTGSWFIVHNGTIANDKELRTHRIRTSIDSAAIAEVLAQDGAFDLMSFARSVRKLKGSYAILAANSNHPSVMYAAANYRPLWYVQTEHGVFFASSRDFFPTEFAQEGRAPQMLRPYTAALFGSQGLIRSHTLYPYQTRSERALVVCSGGLDSVVSATYAQRELGLSIHLVHFLYGSRAEGPEVEAIKKVAQELGCPLTLKVLPVYDKSDSKLLDPDSKVAGGEEGAEFAHEWVPARNLLLLSVATAMAEAAGIDTIVLGNNLEEAGAYPDNEPEFIARFNDLLPFAVGDGKRMRVIMPVGNMMKHEIVALGHKLGAPMHLTWSCYRAGTLHCGKCGPCYMRRKAFEINKLPEVITYEDNQ